MLLCNFGLVVYFILGLFHRIHLHMLIIFRSKIVVKLKVLGLDYPLFDVILHPYLQWYMLQMNRNVVLCPY